MEHILKGGIIGVVYGVSWLFTNATTIDERSTIPIVMAAGIILFTGTLVAKLSAWKTKVDLEFKQLRVERQMDIDVLRSDLHILKTAHVTIPRDSFKPTVLIVDDNKFDRELARRNLENHNFMVMEAASLEDAKQILHANRVDAVLLDLNLGHGATGSRTAAEFVRDFPKALCIALTGYEDPQLRAETLAAGADAFALKNDTADPAYLPKMIRTAMDRHALKGRA